MDHGEREAEAAAYFEGRDDGRLEGAEELLAGMSPDVRKLVEFDAKFRLASVIRQLAENKAINENFGPDWGVW